MVSVTDSSVRAEPSSAIRDVLERALEGRALDREDGYLLFQAAPHELDAICRTAAPVRDRGRGRTVTYSRKVFIPLTNLCRDKCGYCTFAKAPRDPAAKTMSPDEVLAVAEAGRDRGCKEALFSLGERPEERYAAARNDLKRFGYAATNAYLADMCRAVFEQTGLIPHANAGVMSWDDLLRLREVNGSMGMMLESVSERLLERGQAHFGCAGKAPSVRLDMLRMAGELEIAFTTGILIGIGETLEERVDSLLAIREVHQRYGHIQEVIIQNFRVKPTIRMRNWQEPPVSDMLRTIAIARLLLGPDMNVQAPPNLYVEEVEQVEDTLPPGGGGWGRRGNSLASDVNQGHEVFPAFSAPRANVVDVTAYLDAGINDWGGISPVTIDHINPERAWPAVDALRDATRSAGYELRERLCLYPEYLSRPAFVREGLRAKMESWSDATGLVREEVTQWV